MERRGPRLRAKLTRCRRPAASMEGTKDARFCIVPCVLALCFSFVSARANRSRDHKDRPMRGFCATNAQGRIARETRSDPVILFLIFFKLAWPARLVPTSVSRTTTTPPTQAVLKQATRRGPAVVAARGVVTALADRIERTNGRPADRVTHRVVRDRPIRWRNPAGEGARAASSCGGPSRPWAGRRGVWHGVPSRGCCPRRSSSRWRALLPPPRRRPRLR